MQYKIHIHDRQYSSWDILNLNENENNNHHQYLYPNLNPFDQKLFHEDIFKIDSKEIQIQTSKTRELKSIAGILILKKNKTYGRTPNKKRLYYSCIPYDKHLPTFLVPYDIDIGFEKVFPNKYVLFRFDHWTKQENHPYGLLVETIGDVTDRMNSDIYQLHAKHLYLSTKLKPVQQKIHTHMKTTPLESCIQEIMSDTTRFGSVEDRLTQKEPIFSIDPIGCMDRDDALSIRTIQPNHTYQVSVYIANVAIWIEYFQLYTFLQETNISTIYLQEKTIPMLPTALSEKICSLDCTHPCFAIAMDFEIDLLAKTIQPIHIKQNQNQCLIRISSNFDYTSKNLDKYVPYLNLLAVTQTLHTNTTILDSHEVVAFWMMQMNQEMARKLYKKQMGIFRISTTTITQSESESQSQNSDIFLHIWENSISGKYVQYSPEITDYTHVVMNVPIYTHFTSPIRRMVDIYNQIAWISKPCLEISVSPIFLEKINRDTKIIRKIQMESTILKIISDMDIHSWKGQILQIEENRILVYFPEHKCMFSCKNPKPETSNYNIKQIVDCKFYVFERENEYRKKIKMEIK